MKTIGSDERRLLCAVTRAGTGPPLYIVPSVGMTALSFIHLARSIDPPRPIFSFEFAGMEDDRSPHDSIEDMASAYVAEIRRHQPTGPYYIGGHCFGGIVAHDIVTKLEALDERVALFLVLDTISAGAAKDGPAANSDPDQRRLSSAELAHHIEKMLKLLAEHAKKQLALLPPAMAEQFGGVIRTHVDAGGRYRGLPTKAKIVLLRTRTHDARAFLGWRSISTGGYDEAEVPGDTFSMLRPPHASVLGARLSDILNASR